ncbi:MAG: hypothetical protein HY288_19530 [Planctomycetia bacterium]|nr:hypothetical protein [Planctomycetia bacterium]
MQSDARRWHHVVLTTYGAWLPGDPRGFRARHHREHVEGDYKNPPPAEKFAAKERRSRESLSQDPVTLPPAMRPVVGEALCEKLTRLGAWVLCVAVSGQHVHLLAKLPAGPARHWSGLAKKHATFVLREHGWSGKVWAVRSRATLVRTRLQQVNTYRYILRHADEGAWIGVWKTARDTDGERER